MTGAWDPATSDGLPEWDPSLKEGIPSTPVLMTIYTLDSIPFVSDYWRLLVPFGLGETGPFSFHHSPLPEYGTCIRFSDVTPDVGLLEFMTMDNTCLKILTFPETFATVCVLAFFLHKFKIALYPYFRSLGTSLALKYHGEEWVQKNDERLFKFSEYCFRLLYHSGASVLGLSLFLNDDWWHSSNGGTKNFWWGWPHHDLKADIIWYVIFQAAYNVDALVSLMMLSFDVKWTLKILPVGMSWSKTARGDFAEMMVHHLITNALLIFASSFRFVRLIVAVLIVHDVSDVPVDLSKLANFLKWKKTTVLFFAIMVLLWLITRLLILPVMLWGSMLFESWIIMVQPDSLAYPEHFYTVQPGFALLMGGIVALHLIWFIMFIKMAIVLISKGEAHDLSEHKKGEKKDVVPIKKVTQSKRTKKDE